MSYSGILHGHFRFFQPRTMSQISRFLQFILRCHLLGYS
jgi:hypothetical protein